MRTFVSLDELGPSSHVVVEAPTGIVYEQQYGGTACLQGRIEGFLVPVESSLTALIHFFEHDFRGSGRLDDRLRAIVTGITYWASDGLAAEPHALRLDESRLHAVDEAWVPVLTPDGPGILLWPNSD